MDASVLCVQVLIWNDLQNARFKEVGVPHCRPFHHPMLSSVHMTARVSGLTRVAHPQWQVKNERALLRARSLSPVAKKEVNTQALVACVNFTRNRAMC